MDITPVGAMLTALRIGLVNSFYSGPILDIGIGGGKFVTDRAETDGYDVNTEARAWLMNRGKFRDPYVGRVAAITCWDSLEHIDNPGSLLRNVDRFVFVSIPIFLDAAHVLVSKHYRKTEHYWYFTAPGLIWFMDQFGFGLAGSNVMEQSVGREDIGTFVFERVARYGA